MISRTGEELRKRNLENCYFNVYCISTKLELEGDKGYSETKVLYTFFGCTLDGRKKFIACALDVELDKTSDWYDFFQGLKKKRDATFNICSSSKKKRDKRCF